LIRLWIFQQWLEILLNSLLGQVCLTGNEQITLFGAGGLVPPLLGCFHADQNFFTNGFELISNFSDLSLVRNTLLQQLDKIISELLHLTPNVPGSAAGS